jgi:hypothetical protein
MQAAASSPAPAAGRAAAAPAKGGGEGGGPDVNKLAEQVFRLLKQRLRIERERQGLR